MLTRILACLSLILLLYKRISNFFILALIFAIFVPSLLRGRKEELNFLHMQDIASSSKYSRLDPLIKLSFCIFTIALNLISKSRFILILNILMSLYILHGSEKLSLRVFLKIIKPALVFIFISSLGIVLIFTREKLGYLDLGPISVSRASQDQAIELLILGLSCLFSLMTLNLTTRMGDMLGALKRLRLPKVFIELMYLVYRYIFLLFYQLSLGQKSAKSRLAEMSFSSSFRSFKYIGSSLFNRSIRMSLDSYTKMEARAYDGSIEFIRGDYQLGKEALVYLFSSLLLLAVFVKELIYG